jgi:hypothetical protein
MISTGKREAAVKPETFPLHRSNVTSGDSPIEAGIYVLTLTFLSSLRSIANYFNFV